MKIDSPSSITSCEASIRLEWISTRILPGVAVLLLSIPLCQWADSNLPDGIIPVYVIYMMSVTVLWSMYMAVQYAFVGIAQTRKAKINATTDNNNPHEEDVQTPIFLLEAMPIVAKSNGTESVCDAEVVEEIADKTIATDSKVISEEAYHPDNEPSTVSTASASSTHQQGIDDFYQSQAESQKKKFDTIHEYLLYIMSPFVYEEDMDEFCTDWRFAMDHNYRPEVEWKRYKTKLSSFDVRHLIWSIAIRLGLGKGKVYSYDDCACYIERRFASLCVTASGEPLSHSTLRNLTVTSNSDQIHCDIQGADGLLFHIPSQLGSSC